MMSCVVKGGASGRFSDSNLVVVWIPVSQTNYDVNPFVAGRLYQGVLRRKGFKI